MERRKFIESLGIMAFLPNDLINSFSSTDEIDWQKIKKLFPPSDQMLNLNSGSAGTLPTSIINFLSEKIKEINAGPVYKVWGSWQDSITEIKDELKGLIGGQDYLLALSRNATESLNQVIYYLPIPEGKSIVSARWDYTNVNHAINYRTGSEKLTHKLIDVPIDSLSNQDILELYDQAITDDVELVIVTHITHREGRILPIEEITKIAKSRNCKVLIDGAQSYSHISFDLGEIGADFYATSFHKWFNGPLGTGGLFSTESASESLRHPYTPDKPNYKNFENIGTSAYHQWAGLAASLLFHQNVLDIDSKENRLRGLSTYWRSQLSEDPRIKFSSEDESSYCALSSFQFTGDFSAKKITNKLFYKHAINSKFVFKTDGNYIRISTNVFIDEADLDHFVESFWKVINE